MVLTSHQRLILLVIAAVVIDYLPLINLPLLWSETFFHEISHGLAAILSGGQIHNIVLNFDGSGRATTSGGLHFLVLFSGYAGSALWGLLIYGVADGLSHTRARFMVWAMVIMLAVTLLLWARDFSTIVILGLLLAVYGLSLYARLWISISYFIQLIGIFVMLDAIRSPLYLLDGRDVGDGAALAQLLWLPEIFWVALWFTIAASGLYFLWRLSAEDKNDVVAESIGK